MDIGLINELTVMMRCWCWLVFPLRGSWLQPRSIVVPMFRAVVRRVVGFPAVAAAMGLLVLRIDMTAAGADAAIEDRAAFSIGAVGPLMIVGHRRSGTQVESAAATAGAFTHGVNVSTSPADSPVQGTAVIAARVTSRTAASAEDKRSRGQDATAAGRAGSPCMPVHKG